MLLTKVEADCWRSFRWREYECQPVYRGPSTIMYNGVSGKACIPKVYAATRMYAHYCWCKSGQCRWLLTGMMVSALHCSSVSIGLPSPVDTSGSLWYFSVPAPLHAPSHIGLALLLLSFLLLPFIHALPLLVFIHELWSRHRLILCSHLLFMFPSSPSLVITI